MEFTIAMNGGDDGNSYTHNSKLQQEVLDDTKWLLINCIEDHLDIQKSCKVYTIADLGCSVGPNTFSCVKTIIEAVQNKFSGQSPELTSHPEFQVFFNDTFSNDFNTLFKALPDDRLYMAAGVPGSFYGQLFVKGSINFMHSSFTLHWLAKVPEEVLRKDSGAWNKGRVTYVRSSCEVKKAFTAQFMNDFKTFISARSEELAPGGLMVILIPCKPEILSEPCAIDGLDLLGDALEDMVKEGLVDEELADSFNLPVYIPTSSEVIQVVSSDEHLDILKVEKAYMPIKFSSAEDIKNFGLHTRAATEGIISQHFGLDLPMDDLFERYCCKFKDFCIKFKNIDKIENVFLTVQRVVKGVH